MQHHTKERGKPTAPLELQKLRVQWAWSSVKDAASRKGQDEYLTEARKLPVRLLTSGLGQSLAYLYSKRVAAAAGRAPQGRDLLYRHITDRVAEVLGKAPVGTEGAMPMVIELSAASYRRLSREMQTSAEWLKRFAEGRLKESDPSDGESP